MVIEFYPSHFPIQHQAATDAGPWNQTFEYNEKKLTKSKPELSLSETFETAETLIRHFNIDISIYNYVLKDFTNF